MGNMDEKIEMLKSMIKNSIKKGMWHLLKSPYTWAFIGVLLLIILIMLVLIGASTSASAEGINGTTENFSSASSSSWEQYVKYLHSCEGGGTVYKNGEGQDCYRVNQDGGGGSAVGYGVDIATHGSKLRNLGYSTNIGDLIPVDVVDAIEKEEREHFFKQIENFCSANALELTIYQKYALASRCYNYGYPSGVTVTSYYIYPSSYGFTEAYNSFYNQSTDTHYGDWTKTSFENGLFINFMTHLRYTTGNAPEGWVTRRKSEWCLFQTGYFGWGLKNGGYPTGFDEYCNLASSGNDNQIEGINLYNEDGSVNESSISTLEQQISNYLGRQPINIGGQLSYQVKTEYSNFWSNGGYNYQCAWYAQGRANQYLSYIGSNKRSPTGNGNQMYGDGRDKGFTVNQEKPRANSLICWGAKIGNPWGHVAYVEAVDSDGSIWISHCGGGHAWYGISHLTRDVYSYYTGMPLQGFVYLD